MANPPTTSPPSQGTRVRATSPDGCVVATTDPGRGVSIALRPDRLRGDETWLADQINLALRGLARGHHRARVQAHRRRWGRAPGRPVPRSRAGRLKREFIDGVESLTARARSPRGLAEVLIEGPQDLEVGIEPGALRRIDVGADALAAEVNAALAEALRAFARLVAETHHRIYRPDEQE